MTLANTLEQIEQLYTDNLHTFGKSAPSVGWRDQGSQNLRFDRLVSMVEPDEQYNISDLGCGYGSLLPYLRARDGTRLLSYHGYDISAEMLEEAEASFDSSQAVWHHSGQLETKTDYTVTSGIFNVRFDTTDEEWQKFIIDTLTMMHRHSLKGFSFNLLTSYVDYREPHLYYGDPCFFFDYCKKNMSKKVSLYHDTDLWEWTICVKY